MKSRFTGPKPENRIFATVALGHSRSKSFENITILSAEAVQRIRNSAKEKIRALTPWPTGNKTTETE
jgi:hypothetical protein